MHLLVPAFYCVVHCIFCNVQGMMRNAGDGEVQIRMRGTSFSLLSICLSLYVCVFVFGCARVFLLICYVCICLHVLYTAYFVSQGMMRNTGDGEVQIRMRGTSFSLLSVCVCMSVCLCLCVCVWLCVCFIV